MFTGTNLKYASAHNLRIVLDTIRLYGPLPRKDIAQRTELRLQTVSNITRKLLDEELIAETKRPQEGRGAPTSLLNLNADGAFSVGLDFDREHFTGVLVDFLGKVRQRISIDVHFPKPDEALGLMVDVVHQLIKQEGVNKDSIWGVVVALPGPLGISEGSVVTNVANPCDFPGWTNVPVTSRLHELLDLPIYIENNASAAAVGESWYGRGQHIKSFFYVFFGVGLGGGLVINNRPYEGHNGNAGEIGVAPSASLKKGSNHLTMSHLGAFFSLPTLSQELIKQGIEVSHPEDLGALFQDKNTVLFDWLDQAITQLAPLILTVECILDPEAIFLGGRYPEEMIMFIKEKLEQILPTLRVEENMAHPQLFCATAGEDATALGVSTLPMYSSFAPIPEVLMKQANGKQITNPT